MASWIFFLNNIEVEEPIGWDGIEFMAQRTEEHGIDQIFTTEVTFYGKGAKFIKSLYDIYFINAEIKIKIVSDIYVNGVAWEFNGFLNMALYSEKNVCDTDSWQISVGIIDDNFREKFKSRMDVDVDVYAAKDLDGNFISDPVFDNTRLHTQEVYLVGYAESIKQKYPIDSWATIFWNFQGGWVKENFAAVIPAYKTNTDFQGSFGTQFDPVQVKWSKTNVLFKNNTQFSRTITFDIQVKGAWRQTLGNLPDTTNLALVIGWGNNIGDNGANLNELLLEQTGVVTYPSAIQQYDLNGTATITLAPQWSVFVYFQFGNGGSVYPGCSFPPQNVVTREITIWVDSCCVTITEKNSSAYASFAETMRVENFLKRLVNIVTGDSNGLVSDVFSKALNGKYWNFALTNGLKIRRAQTTIGASQICDPLAIVPSTNFKVSFKKVFDGLSNIFCLGWTFEKINGQWKIRIEPIEYFYKNNIAFTAINIDEVTQSAKTEDLANQFTIGYDDTWKNIQASGVWAIHTDRNYYVNNRAMSAGTTKKVEFLSGIIGEGYAIEFSRRMTFFQDDAVSSDRPNDYELFIIWLNRNDLEIIDIQNSEYKLPPIYNEIGNVVLDSGTASMSSRRINISNSEVNDLYNIAITPARNAYRWWKVLGMHTYGLISPMLAYQTGQYQVQYSSFIDDIILPNQESCDDCLIIETTNIDPAFMNENSSKYLFKPILIEFEYPQSFCDFINLSTNNQFDKVRASSGSLLSSGWIQSIENKPTDAKGGTTRFILIASNVADPEPPPEGRAYSDAYSSAYS